MSGLVLDHLNPIGHPLIFQFPERNTPITDWWGHIPFAKWLVSALRPSLFVELGVYRGDSFSAICQAIATLELDAKAIGVDTWGRAVNNDPYHQHVEAEVEELFTFVRTRYPFAELKRMFFSEAVGSVADNSISLLHIDGDHTYEAVADDYKTWLPKVAPGGIMLFHDIAIGDYGDFGTDRFWGELKAQYPTAWFEFLHAWGLGVLAPKGIPDSMRPLFNATGTSSEEKIQEFFQLMGARNFISTLYRRAYGDGTLLDGLERLGADGGVARYTR